MGEHSLIEWTEATWNPVTGCTKVSAGCEHCYAERLAVRLRKMGNPRYMNGFRVTLHRDLVHLPLKWKRPKMVFVCSMADLFHERVPFEFIQAVFGTMAQAKWHTFQVLTKRVGRLAELASSLPWPPNIWMGTSIEDQNSVWRTSYLRQAPARIRFLSCEPLIGPIRLNLDGIHWVIVGGESGSNARPVAEEWVRSVRDQCGAMKVPFFFKQWGGERDKRGREKAVLDGELWNQWPHLDGQEGKTNSASRGHPRPLLRVEQSTLPSSTSKSNALVRCLRK